MCVHCVCERLSACRSFCCLSFLFSLKGSVRHGQEHFLHTVLVCERLSVVLAERLCLGHGQRSMFCPLRLRKALMVSVLSFCFTVFSERLCLPPACLNERLHMQQAVM